MEFSISELSKHLGVAQSTIERWVRQGKLPVSKYGAGYSFQTSDLKKWAAKRNISLNLDNQGRPEKEIHPKFALSAAVKNGGLYVNIQGNDVSSVLKSSVDRINSIPTDFKIDLYERLLEREQALSTGIGNGIAIPHPRIPLGYLGEPQVVACFLENPVDYNALDGLPVHLLFFILCPDLKFHLHLLSSLSFCLRDQEFVNYLSSGPDLASLIEKIEALQALNMM